MPAFQSDKEMCLNADKSAVVDCDSPEARFVLVGVGGTVSAEDAERLGLSAPAAESEGKAKAAPPENKAKAAPGEAKGKD